MTSTPPGGPVGRRLLPITIDDIARGEPDRTWALLPLKGCDGWQEVKFPMFANAINSMAWFMEEKLGQAEQDSFPTVCYIGKPDVRYQVVEMASAKTGYKVLFSSHINSLAAHLNLLEKTSCQLLMSASGVQVSDILAQRSMKHVMIPEFDDLFTATPVRHYPFPKSFSDAQDDPFLILHTSGSTGLPKPVTFTHAVIAAQDAHSSVSPFSPAEAQKLGWQRQKWPDLFAGRFTSPFAPFHIIIAIPTMMYTVFGTSTYVSAARDTLAHAPDVVATFNICDTAWLNPSTLEAIASSPAWLAALAKLDHVLYGGGTLAPATGNQICRHTRLINIFGTTELGGMLLSGEAAREDWAYILFDPALNGIDWRAGGIANDGSDSQMYEMVIVAEPALAELQSVFRVFPDREEHALGDLWTKHPVRPHMWRYAGRVDDLICFSHGVKFNPLGVQDKIKAHPFVKEALLFGERHEQAVLLIELAPDALDLVDQGKQEHVRDSVWEMVEEMNKDLPSVAKIAETHVVFAPRGKGFARAVKGTVMKFHTIKAFEKEIEECYAWYGDEAAGMLGRVERSINL